MGRWRRTPINWEIFTDDLETDYTNVVNPIALGLIAVVTPSMLLGKGKDLHKAGLQELRLFVNNFDGKVVVNRDKAIVGSRDKAISFTWGAELRMNTFFQQQNNSTPGGGVAPKPIVAIEAHSWFHLNDEGKIY